MKMNRPLFKPGDIVQHFKRETIENPRDNEYLYEVVGFARHTQTRSKGEIRKNKLASSYLYNYF